MAETSRLRSSVGCFYCYLRPLGLIHWCVIKSMRNDILFIFPFRFREIFYCTGRFDQRCFSCGTISNRVHCYDVGSPCDLDIWDPSSWKVGAKMNLGAYYSSIPMEWTSGSEAVGPYRDRVIIDALLRNQIYFSTLSSSSFVHTELQYL